jgi:hypothetical protein
MFLNPFNKKKQMYNAERRMFIGINKEGLEGNHGFPSQDK